MRPSCDPHATFMRPSCDPHATLMRPSCDHHATIMRPSCDPHATPKPGRGNHLFTQGFGHDENCWRQYVRNSARMLVLRESWGLVLAEKLEFCIMEAIEFKFEERLVTKAVGLPQEGFDLVVDAFHPAVVDAVLPPVQDSTSMEGESFGQLLHLTNARVDRPLAPFFEEDLHLVQAG